MLVFNTDMDNRKLKKENLASYSVRLLYQRLPEAKMICTRLATLLTNKSIQGRKVLSYIATVIFIWRINILNCIIVWFLQFPCTGLGRLFRLICLEWQRGQILLLFSYWWHSFAHYCLWRLIVHLLELS